MDINGQFYYDVYYNHVRLTIIKRYLSNRDMSVRWFAALKFPDEVPIETDNQNSYDRAFEDAIRLIDFRLQERMVKLEPLHHWLTI